MNLNIRYCKQCKQAYDIAVNFDICPECRINEVKKGVNGDDRKN